MDTTVPKILQHNISVQDPNLDHISRNLYKSILYEPSDDSFLFMEAMDRDLNTLRVLFSSGVQIEGVKPPIEPSSNQIETRIIGTTEPTILELGPGTGIISSYTARLLSAAPILVNQCTISDSEDTTGNGSTVNNNSNDIQLPTDTLQGITFPTKCHPTTHFSPRVVALDLNPVAVEMTTKTFAINNPDTRTEVHESDLLSQLPQHYLNSVNLLLFNPPYVPSEDYEHENRDPKEMIMNAYAGGSEGRVILDRLIPQLATLYTPSTPITTSSDPQSDSPTRPFVFYCVFLWPINNITSLNQLMNDSLSQATHTPGRTYKSHIIMARQCGLESLAIIRYIPDCLYSRLPDELKGLHPPATEDNFKSIFQPKLIPFSIPGKVVKGEVSNHLGDAASAQGCSGPSSGLGQTTAPVDSEDDDDDDEDGASGFSLF